jgi:endonuclease/exonuclease/phosphatase family metal-dependent hydrolase
MSWNIHRAIGMDRKFAPERIVEVVRHHKPDILLMQEVDRGVPRSRRLWLDHEIAKACELPWHSWAQAHVLKVGSYGNATLSRFPIFKRKHLDLTITRKKRRAALYTRIRLPGHYKDFHVFNWHLGLSALERQKQVHRLFRTGTWKSLRKNARVVLGGDTNDWRNLLFHKAVKREGLHAWSEHRRRQHILTYPSPAPAGALDKFFWRGPLGDEHIHRSRMNLAKVASDHLPLLAEFELL